MLKRSIGVGIQSRINSSCFSFMFISRGRIIIPIPLFFVDFKFISRRLSFWLKSDFCKQIRNIQLCLSIRFKIIDWSSITRKLLSYFQIGSQKPFSNLFLSCRIAFLHTRKFNFLELGIKVSIEIALELSCLLVIKFDLKLSMSYFPSVH